MLRGKVGVGVNGLGNSREQRAERKNLSREKRERRGPEENSGKIFGKGLDMVFGGCFSGRHKAILDTMCA